MSDFLETIDRMDKLLDLNKRIESKLIELKELAVKGEEENNAGGLTLETCEAGMAAFKKAENRTVRLLRGLYRTHELLAKYSEGDKPFP